MSFLIRFQLTHWLFVNKEMAKFLLVSMELSMSVTTKQAVETFLLMFTQLTVSYSFTSISITLQNQEKNYF